MIHVYGSDQFRREVLLPDDRLDQTGDSI